jgi:broad specificity phosphatase PhoE
MDGMTLAYLVQHGEKEPLPGDPGLTGAGRAQAARAGQWLLGAGVRGVCASPMRRARETAGCIAAVTGLAVRSDDRLRERLNWDGSVSFDVFLDMWARAVQDRDWVPAGGESSRQAGRRLAGFLAGLPAASGPVAVVTHGGITVDLLRDILSEDALPSELLTAGVPPCAITTVDDLNVIMIASVSHLR